MRLTLAEIAAATGGALCPEVDGSAVCTGITWDSRAVKPQDLYVALPGERVDGHDFIESALQAGASGVLAAREVDPSVPAVVVDDTAAALTELAAFWRTKLSGTVIGLTGSSGKTSTKNLVRDVLAHRGTVVATLANQNNELGVPNTLLGAEEDTQAVVVEMGMRGLGQIEELCRCARPDWGLITNIGESHIELLGSRENIAWAKAELLEALPDKVGVAFVNAADDFAGEVCRHARLDERGVTTVFYEGYGAWDYVDELEIQAHGNPFVWASDIQYDSESRPTFTLHAAGFQQLGNCHADGEVRCALELRGAHNVSNACAATAVGLASGMTLAECAEALASSQPEKGRQQVARTADGVTIVDDSYNANPDSMRASLATFSALAVDGRRIAVLGDMLELGSFSQECHERVGAYAAASSIDFLVCVGELSGFIAQSAQDNGMSPESIVRCPDAESALAIVSEQVKPGDAVLVKASHSIGLDAVAKGLVS